MYKKYENSDPIINSDWEDIDVDTLKDHDGLGSITDRPEAGYNEYEIILIGDEKISKSELVKVYDENYLEMHNTSLVRCQHTMLETVIQLGGDGESTTDGKMWKPLAIRGVIHYDNQQCDVIECKKNGLTVKHPNYRGGNNYDWPFYCSVATKDYLKLVSEEFGRGPGDSGGCGDFVGDTQDTESNAYLRSEGCTDNQINELSKRMVTVHFIAAACEIIALRDLDYLEEIRDEGININDIHLMMTHADFQKAKESAIGMTMACTRRHEETYINFNGGEGDINIPGTLSHFTNEGFIQIGDLTEHEESIRQELPRLLSPGVGGVVIRSADGKPAVEYYLINKEKIEEVEVTYCRKQHARDIYVMRGGNLVKEETYSCADAIQTSRDIEYAYATFEKEGFNGPGMYRAIVKIRDTVGWHEFEGEGGVYNKEYLETYGGNVGYHRKNDGSFEEIGEVSVRIWNETGKKWVECGSDCNIRQKKVEAFRATAPEEEGSLLSNDDIRVRVYDEWKEKNEGSGCHIEWNRIDKSWQDDDHYFTLADCSDREVSELYKSLLSTAYEEAILAPTDGRVGDGNCKELKETEGHEDYPDCHQDRFNCNTELYSLFKIPSDKINHVCEAKTKLKEKLDKIGWGEI